MDINSFQNEIKKNFPFVEKNFFDKIEIYKKFIQEENKKFNLSNLVDEQKIYSMYFYESLIPYKNNINDFQGNISVLDIGSGSGIPGIVLKLLFPNINLSILEANAKKINFIKELANKLDLTGISFLNKRAEEINNDEKEKFDIVTSRAVAPLKILCEISIPYLKVGGKLIEPKSKNIHNELNDAMAIIKKMFSNVSNICTFISINDIEENVVLISKLKSTKNIPIRKWKDIIK